MDNTKIFENNVSMYIKNSLDKYALLIDGPWGSGKTHAVKTLLKKISPIKLVGENKNQNEDVIYLSLNGVKSIDDLFFSYLINETGNPKSHFSCELLKEVTGLDINNMIKHSFSAFESIIKKEKPVKAIIFDDLERCKCDISEIFACIDKLLSHNIKVILIINSTELSKSKKIMFDKFKEKIIGNTINWNPDEKIMTSVISNDFNLAKYEDLGFNKSNLLALEQILKNFFSLDNNSRKTFQGYAKFWTTPNLRVVKKVVSNSIYIINLLEVGTAVNVKPLYEEIVKNVFIMVIKETYSNDPEAQNWFITLSLVEDYFKNGNYINKAKYIEIVDYFLNLDENLEIRFTDRENEFLFREKGEKLIQSINICPLYHYDKIFVTLCCIDSCLNTNYLDEAMPKLIKNIEKDDKYIFYIDKVSLLKTKLSLKQDKCLREINNKLDEHNLKVMKKKLDSYLLSPFSTKEFTDVFKENIYTEEVIKTDIKWWRSNLLEHITNSLDKETVVRFFEDNCLDVFFNFVYQLEFYMSSEEKLDALSDFVDKIEKIILETSDSYYKYYLSRKIQCYKKE